MTTKTEYTINLKGPHAYQQEIRDSKAKRKIVQAGRRGGKTIIASIMCVEAFIKGLRPLYATPTAEQLDAWWYEVTKALAKPVIEGKLYKNETEHLIERRGTKKRIRGKTAWNANTLRGDYTDFLVLDEFQLMAEDTWNEVGAPMLLDNNGDALFIFTPPSLHSSGVSKARDPRHASKLFKRAQEDSTGLWEAFHFTSLDNPHISEAGLATITSDMSLDSYRREIMAQDDEIEQSWLVYGKFDERVCRIPRFPIPKEWPVYSGHDFGKANPAALFLAQNPGTGDFVAFNEYCPGAGRSIATHVEAFQDICAGYNILRRVGGNITTEDEIRQGYTAHGWPIIAPKITKVNAQLDRVIGLMELNKVFIFDDLFNTLSQISNCMWKLDDENKPTNKVDNEEKYHLLACLRYIGSEFRPETAQSITVGTTRRSIYL